MASPSCLKLRRKVRSTVSLRSTYLTPQPVSSNTPPLILQNVSITCIEVSSPERGHKLININTSEKIVMCLEVSGKPVELDRLPRVVILSYNTTNELLRLLNLLCNLRVCDNREKTSPNCSILTSSYGKI